MASGNRAGADGPTGGRGWRDRSAIGKPQGFCARATGPFKKQEGARALRRAAAPARWRGAIERWRYGASAGRKKTGVGWGVGALRGSGRILSLPSLFRGGFQKSKKW
jgi:hypothetical protein